MSVERSTCPATHNGYENFVSFIDHFSHFAVIYLMKEKKWGWVMPKKIDEARWNDFEMIMALSASNISSEVPASYDKAIKSEERKNAIDAELN